MSEEESLLSKKILAIEVFNMRKKYFSYDTIILVLVGFMALADNLYLRAGLSGVTAVLLTYFMIRDFKEMKYLKWKYNLENCDMPFSNMKVNE